MTFEYIFSTADAEARSNFNPESHLSGAIVATGKNQELVWAKFELGGTYAIHTHPYEQVSVMLQGRMRLTVGEEVRELGPGDMWYAPANVPHGGGDFGRRVGGLRLRLCPA